MSRKLTVVVACLACGVHLSDVSIATAQDGSPGRTASAERSPSAGQPAERRVPRPKAEPLRLPNLPQAPNAILQAWSEKTKGVEKLQGQVRRITYDFVFKSEKHADGKFYYENPDKGRIDLEAMTFKPNAKAGRWKQGFTLAPDRDEEWICDGTKIYAIDREQKTANVFPIPPENRGQNIMNGPLPFLFGMPPDQARERYWLFLKDQTDQSVHIVAYPKWQQDRGNYKSAEVILDKANFLPIAVRLEGPAGNSQTVYTFKGVAANRPGLPFAKPFAPNLKGLKVVQAVPRPPAGKDAKTLPALSGLREQDAKFILEKLKLQAEVVEGPPAEKPEFVHRVFKQTPAEGSPFEEGETVTLTVFAEPAGPAPDAPQGLQMPKVVGLHGKKAQTLLTGMKVVPKFYKGDPAPAKDVELYVYEQDPAPGEPLEKGQVVKLTLYVEPQASPQ